MLRLLTIAFCALSLLPAQAAKVRILGMRSMSESEAIELISARLEYVTKRDASASRADDAAFLLTRRLVQRGFTNPTVDWDLPGGNQIVLNVVEGQRSTVGDVVIDAHTGELVAVTCCKGRPCAVTGGARRASAVVRTDWSRGRVG